MTNSIVSHRVAIQARNKRLIEGGRTRTRDGWALRAAPTPPKKRLLEGKNSRFHLLLLWAIPFDEPLTRLECRFVAQLLLA